MRRCLEQLEQHPQSTTATLLEVFRETPVFDALNALAAWDHQVPTDALADEFIETVNFLIKQSENRDIDTLIEKARHGALTESERSVLQLMLQNRHRETKHIKN